MALNFPASPTPGQVYTAEGATFIWNGTVWASAATELPKAHNISLFASGVPQTDELLLRFEVVVPFSFPAAMAGSIGGAGGASVGAAVFSLKKNGTEFGTLTYTSSATGVFAASSATGFAEGDTLSIVGPGAGATGPSDLSLTLEGVTT